LADFASPRAVRLATPRWYDARFLLGLLLVLVAVVAGARLVTVRPAGQAVLVARHALLPGQRLTAGDVSTIRVGLGSAAARYVSASALPAGYRVSRPVGAGELVPYAALSGPVPAARLVNLPVQAGHAPGDLVPGQRVDVYVTPRPAGGAPTGPPRLVVATAEVTQDASSGGWATGGGELDVVVSVRPAAVASLVQAVENGAIDLVQVPSGQPTGSTQP
jgi:Flp pilus assembly protein CpaB